MYITNLKQDMKSKLKEQGYIVEDIKLEIETENEKNYGKIKQISISVYKSEEEENVEESTKVSIVINKVEDVKIGENSKSTKEPKKNDIKNSEKNEIKKYLSSVYEVNKKNIKVNE